MPVLLPSLLTMVAAQLFDLGTFVQMLRRVGPAAETNPFVAGALSSDGLPTIILAKLVLVLFLASLAVVLTRARQPRAGRIAAFVIGASIVAGLVGGGSNALAIGVL
jgi:hypothetical protein